MRFSKLVLSMLAGLLLVPSTASAESFTTLSKKGYAVGPLAAGKSGSLGWVVSKDGKAFFCKMKVSTVYIGKDKMASFTSGGRMIPIDKAVFEASIGGHDSSIPQLSDLKAGKVQPRHVGSCIKNR